MVSCDEYHRLGDEQEYGLVGEKYYLFVTTYDNVHIAQNLLTYDVFLLNTKDSCLAPLRLHPTKPGESRRVGTIEAMAQDNPISPLLSTAMEV